MQDKSTSYAAGANELAQDDSHPELQPAGRAILLLIDEVERLRAAETVTNGPPDDPPPAGDGGDSAADAQPRRPSRARNAAGSAAPAVRRSSASFSVR